MPFNCDICGKTCATPHGLSAHRGSNVCLRNATRTEASTSSAASQPLPNAPEAETRDLDRTIPALRYVECELAGTDNLSPVGVERVDGRPDKLIGTIQGPTGTAYEAGIFFIDVDIPPQYPFKPPKIHFITKIWHPNVHPETGKISGNLFEHDWTAAMTVRGLLMTVHTLLSTPILADDKIADSAVAVQFTANRNLFDRTARYWSQVHAHAPGTEPDLNNKVVNMMEMGFDQFAAIQVLSETWWNAAQAIEKLALRVRLSGCSQFTPSN